MVTAQSTPQSAETEQYNVIGTRPIRHDGVDKVTGAAQYGADINLPGMLAGRVLRSPHAHARNRQHRHLQRRKRSRACSPSSPTPTSPEHRTK